MSIKTYSILGVVVIIILVTSMSLFSTNNDVKNGTGAEGTVHPHVIANQLLEKTLYALKFTEKDVLMYNYFFLYSPTTEEKALVSPNFPSSLSKEELSAFLHSYTSLGYFTLSPDGLYRATGLDFLIKQTDTEALKELHAELLEWKTKSIQ